MTLHQQHLEKIRTSLFEALGEVSAPYWRDAGTVFDSEEATRIGNEVLEVIKKETEEYAKGFARWIKTSGYENVHDEQKYWVNIKAPVGHIYKNTDQLLSLYGEHLSKLEKEKIK